MRLRKKKSLIEQAGDYVDTVVDTVRPQVEAAIAEAREKAGPALADARSKATPYLLDARDRAVELATEAREKAGPALADARSKAAPVVAAGATFAASKAEDLGTRASAGLAGASATATDAVTGKVAALKGEQPKKGSKLKKVVLIGGLATAVAVVARKLQGGHDSSSWQSSYVPSAPPKAAPSTPSVPTPAAGADDTGGSSPDEALADQAEGAREATTPDSPAEVIDLEGGSHKK
jgi:hypothetical protein